MFELQPAIEESPARTTIRRVARYLPSLGVGLFFIVIGYTKFDGDPNGQWVRLFDRIGVGQWFRIVTAVVQVSGGALMLWPRARTVGAAMLASTMAGAACVDLFVLGSPVAVVPLMLLFLIVAVWATSE
jgi:putative oxidoreductase